jgi:ABC-type transport system involved in multi-copper enzyme maturation permease subunit
MSNLLKVEFYKLRRFMVFYSVIGLLLVFYAYAAYKNGEKHLFTSIYQVFADSLPDTSLSFFIAILTAMFVGNDFSTRTLDRELVTGANRWNVIISRLIPVWIMNIAYHTLSIVLYMAAIGITTGYSFDGFGISDLAWFGTVMLQVAALATVITLITFICGNIYGGLTASVITLFALCNILRNFTASPLYRSSCFCFAVDSSSATLIRCAVCAAVTIAAAMIATYAVFGKRDIS